MAWSLTLRSHDMVPNPERLLSSEKKEASTQPIIVERESIEEAWTACCLQAKERSLRRTEPRDTSTLDFWPPAHEVMEPVV